MCQELFTIVNKTDKNLSILGVYFLVWEKTRREWWTRDKKAVNKIHRDG